MEDEITILFGDSSKIENDGTEYNLTFKEFLTKTNKMALTAHKERIKKLFEAKDALKPDDDLWIFVKK